MKTFSEKYWELLRRFSVRAFQNVLPADLEVASGLDKGPGATARLVSLEPRVFFSASPLGDSEPQAVTFEADWLTDVAATDGSIDSSASVDFTNAATAAEVVTRLILADRGVEGIEKLANELRLADESHSEIVYIDSGLDSWETLNELFAKYDSINELHIVSHGSDGSLQLGELKLSQDSLLGQPSFAVGLQQVLADDGLILLYGCNVANSDAGRLFVDTFAELTQATVYASLDLTGADALGGDWQLEYSSESSNGFSINADWFGLLSGPVTITVTTTSDLLNGDTSSYSALIASDGGDGVSLREAITVANLTSDADTIVFSLGPGIHTINLLSNLPEIDRQLTMDGGLAVELNGFNAGGNTNGLHFVSGSDNSLISGLIINRFQKSGILLEDVHNVSIVGNYIGTDTTGSFDRGNGDNGIEIRSSSSNNIIGGVTLASRNVISGNDKNGILITDSNSNDNLILGNLIGTDITGNTALGNSQHGILLESNASHNIIGGINVGEGNTIAFNGKAGVAIKGNGTDFNTIRGNSFFSNSGLAIDLNDDGVTANDLFDGDNGENDLLNFPTLFSAHSVGGDTTVSGVLQSKSNVNGLIIDFYWSNTADASGYGEARDYIGSTTVNTDALGFAWFTKTFVGVAVPAASQVTAAVTDTGGNTSEFSLNRGSTFDSTIINKSEFLVNQATTDLQITSHDDRGSHRSVAIDSFGNYIVVWSSANQDGAGWEVYGRRFDANGIALTDEFHVNTIAGDNEQFATVAMNASGQFVVTWTSDAGADTSVYYRVFDAGGAAVTTDLVANTTAAGSQQDSSVAIDSAGNFIIVWEGNGDQPGQVDTLGIFGQRFNSLGGKIGGEFLVNSGLTAGGQYEPVVAMNGTGKFAVLWDDASGVHVRRFNSDGTQNGSRIDVDGSATAGDGSLAMANDDSIAVVWRSGTVVDREVYVRRYNSSGAAVGAAQLVASTSAGNQTDPSVSFDKNGNFIVVWEGNGANSSNVDDSGVFAQKYSSLGAKVGGEFLINQTTAGVQSQTSVALLDLNNFVVVWSGNGAQVGQEDTSGVFARQFGQVIGPVNNAPTITSQPPQEIAEYSIFVFAASNFGYNDVDGDSFAAVRIDGVNGGTLMLENVMIQPGDIVSIADINAAKLRFVPNGNQSGAVAAQIDYKVSDGTDYSATGIFTFNINALPIANTDNRGVVPSQNSTTINIADLLTNDFDANGDALLAIDFGRTEHGILVDNGDGTLTYTPDPGYSGTDSFQYTITDGSLRVSHYFNLDNGAVDQVGGLVGTTFGTTPSADGNGLDFDGANQDHIVLPDIAYNDSFTLEIAFFVDDLAGTGFRYMYSHGLPDEGLQIFLREAGVSGGSPQTLATIVRDSNDSMDSHELNIDMTGMAGSWHRYTLVVEKDVGSKVYLDGVLKATTGKGADGVNPAGNALIGGRADLSSTRFMKGSLGDLMILDRALAATEVSSLPTTMANQTGTVNLVVNSVPVATNDSFTTNEGSVFAGTIGGNDSDANGDALSFNLVSGPTLGNLVFNVNGTFNYDATIDFEQLAVGQSQVEAFTYRVTDEHGDSATATATIIIHGINDSPLTLQPTLTFTTNEGTVLNGSGLLSNHSDVDGDSLRVNPTPIAGPQHGTLTLNTNGSFVYTPGILFSGIDSFAYQVLDGHGGTATATVNLQVHAVNHSPTITSATSTLINENQNSVLTIVASDLDGDAIQFGISGAGADDHLFAIDTVTGQLQFINAPDYENALDSDHNNQYQIRISASDGSNTVFQNMTVSIQNVVEAAQLANDLFNVSENGVFSSRASSVLRNDTFFDQGLVTIDIVSMPIHGWVNMNTDGSFVYQHDGSETLSDSFVYRVIESSGQINTATVVMSISPVDDAPIAHDDTLAIAQISTFTIDRSLLLQNDLDIDSSLGAVTIINQPTVGTIHIDQNGSLVFVASKSFSETSFSYVVESNGISSNKAVVTLVSAVTPPPSNTSQLDTEDSSNSDPANGTDMDPVDPGISLAPPPKVANTSVVESPSGNALTTPISNLADTRNNASDETLNEDNRDVLDGYSHLSKFDSTAARLEKGLVSDLMFFNLTVTGNSNSNTMDPIEWLSSYFNQTENQEEEFLILNEISVPVTATTAAGLLSVGYLAWMIRGGVLLTTFVSSLPAWQSFDPLVVVQNSTREEGESIEEMVDTENKE